MDNKAASAMLSAIFICMVDRGEFINFEKDAPPEKIIRLEDVGNIISEFKKDVENQGD